VEDLRGEVNRLSANLYMNQQTRLASIFSAPSPGGALDQLTFAVNVAQDESTDLANLRQAEAAYASRSQQLDALASQQAGEQEQLAAQRAAILAHIAALQQLRASAGGAYTVPASLPVPATITVAAPAVSGTAGRAVAFALAQLGKPYSYGAAGPGAFDCSGLTMAAWAAAGVGLPHNAAEQWGSVAHISRADLRPGDLVFYFGDIHHVALYLGDNRVIHAPTYGQDVRVQSIDLGSIYGYGRPG
jgi:cell wall-associated NlpC family hydrolase